MLLETVEDLFRRLEQLNEVGAALSQERDIDHLLEKILLAAKAITRAAGGTLYVLEPSDEGPRLRFAIMRNEAMGIAMGGTTGNPIPFYPVHLYGKDGTPNNQMVAAYTALTGKTVNIADAYSGEGFDFSGTRNFDKKTGYRSKAFLTVPMKNHEGEIIGVLQLINSVDPATNEIGPFSHSDQRLAESLASQAAIALTNRSLINQLEELFESFIELINTAIDEKSKYTGGHCQRVPVLTMMLAEAVNETTEGPLGKFNMSEKDRYELKIAGMLHDCGKVTTPVHVVDKATKLETIFDRINLVDTRFEVLKRDLEIAALKEKLKLLGESTLGEVAARKRLPQIDETLRDTLRKVEDDREFLRRANVGGEAMAPEERERVNRIGTGYKWIDVSGVTADFLTVDEIKNLTISRGTQSPYRCDHQDAGSAAVAEASESRTGVRRGSPRADGREGLSSWTEAGADVGAGKGHGDRGYFRGADRQGQTLQARQDAFRVAEDPRELQGGRTYRPGLVRHICPQEDLSALRRAISRSRSDRRGRRKQDTRICFLIPLDRTSVTEVGAYFGIHR